jgi:hypothetical protein
MAKSSTKKRSKRLAPARRARVRAEKPEPVPDLAVIVDRTEDDEGFHVLRRRGDAPVEVGTLRPLKEGQPIEGEVISLKPRKDVPFIYDVKTKLPDPRRRLTSDGPPQVATKEYRTGWEAIWGKRRDGAKAN